MWGAKQEAGMVLATGSSEGCVVQGTEGCAECKASRAVQASYNTPAPRTCGCSRTAFCRSLSAGPVPMMRPIRAAMGSIETT